LTGAGHTIENRGLSILFTIVLSLVEVNLIYRQGKVNNCLVRRFKIVLGVLDSIWWYFVKKIYFGNLRIIKIALDILVNF
jgi:hypothetical protein